MSEKSVDDAMRVAASKIVQDIVNSDGVRLTDGRENDEIRRLLYGSLAAGRTRRWELVGTLVNALVHHVGLVEDPWDLIDYLVEIVEAPIAGAGGYERGQRVRDLIAELSS